MKHTMEEMIFAALLRERVASLRTAKTRDMSEEEAKAFISMKAGALIEEAMKELEGIAEVVKKIREQERQPPTP